jgi:hypothetical protein
LDYATLDKDPASGIYYYRLKQTDYDGSFEYAKTVAVIFTGMPTFNLWPNPATDRVFLKMEQDLAPKHLGEDHATITLYNAIGKQVIATIFQGPTMQLNIVDLDKGVYSVHIQSAGKTYRSRFIKE